jgi:type III secretion protein J
MRTVFRPLLLLFIATLLAGCAKNVTLQASLHDTDANEIVLALTAAGIVVAKHQDKTGVSLQVAEADIPRATAVMQAAGLPRRNRSNLGGRNRSNLGEVFKKQGMISSPMEERIRYLHGLSEELEATLQQFDNVVAARVHVVLPERIAPGEPIQPSSAAVFIKYRMPMPRVRRLVASSIPGLVGEDGRSKVTVVMTPAEAPPPAVEWTMVGPFKIESGSATTLVSTLWIMGALIVLGIGFAGFSIAQRHPALAGMMARRAARRGAAAEAEVAG